MSVYEKLKIASDNKDADAYLDMLHDDFVFVRQKNKHRGNEK